MPTPEHSGILLRMAQLQKKTSITLPPELVAKIDKLAKGRLMTRSKMIQKLLLDALKSLRK